MAFIGGLIIGLTIGTVMGFIIACLCSMAAKSERQQEHLAKYSLKKERPHANS